MTKKFVFKHYNSKYVFLESTNEVFEMFNTSNKGLSYNEVVKRKERFGINSITKKDNFRALKLFFNKFNSILIYVLGFTAVITYYLGHMIEFYSILFVIAFSVILSFIHEFRAEKSVAALASLTAKKVEVIRDSTKKVILAEDLVPGDVIVLKRGLVVPADLRIIESNGLSINESLLTGESVPKQKHNKPLKDEHAGLADLDNMAFSGTSIMNGNGLGVVIATGFNTEIGKISETLISIKDQKTPIQKKVDTMSKRVSYVIILLSIFTLFVLMNRGEDLTTALILVAALAVAGIPEEFPLALTMALSSGIKKMAGSKALVKDMSSVETLGTTTVICTDKTGTLTQNKMMVVKLFLDGEIDVEGKPLDSKATFTNEKGVFSKNTFDKHKNFFLSSILCNDSEIHKKHTGFELFGDPTEGALLGLAKSAGFDDIKIKNQNPRVFEVPFDSEKKYMITVNKNKGYTAYLKGAVERVLDKSDFIRVKGRVRKLTLKDKKEITEVMHSFSSQALRVLALATKKLNSKSFEKESRKGYVFEGLVGIEDPLRPEVKKSIDDCKTAGIRIIMITGDHKSTAKAIGDQLGLFSRFNYRIIEGHELDKLSDNQLDKIISEVVIFSRATPDHKFRIVKSLQRNGEIVAMTGDGVNDAPALKQADIGVSMGKEGTDVAREASNLVLLDDAFSSIVTAVKEGRTIYSNIRRFTYFLLSVNAAEVGIILVAIIFNLVTPLTALMILFINVVISSLPALGLSVEATHDKVMHRLPRKPTEKLVSNYILLKMSFVVPLIIAGALALFLWELNTTGNVDKARTFAFATIIVAELFHTFNARSLHTTIFTKRLFTNKYIYLGILLSIFLVIGSIYNGWANDILGTAPLNPIDWLFIALISSPVILVSEFVKKLIKSEIEEQKLSNKNLTFE